MARPDDTIFALATPPGRGGIAVVRVSGARADDALRRLTHARLPKARIASVRRLLSPSGDVIDEAMVIRFLAGASFTGEPVAEFHCHGSRAVVHALLNALGAIPDCRLAEPGEFTRRAFLSGRLDLAQVEALGDLLTSETAEQHRSAISGMLGGTAKATLRWREMVQEARALIEAAIDWTDEEIPEDVTGDAARLLASLQEELSLELSNTQGRERLSDGFTVAVVGPPNAGKSSFINYLAGREAAIAAPSPGTTRDVIELAFDLEGFPVTFLDTAGLREATDVVEQIGIARSRVRASEADLRLHLAPARAAPPDLGDMQGDDDIAVTTKGDLGAPAAGSSDGHCISVVTGAGIPELLADLRGRLAARVGSSGSVATARQRLSVSAALQAVGNAVESIHRGSAEEAAEELRQAALAFDRLLGVISTEDVLGAVFARFCVGK